MAVIGVHEILVQPTLTGQQKALGKELDGHARDAGKRAGGVMGGAIGTALKVGGAAAVGGAIAGIGTALTRGFGRLRDIEQAQATLTGLGHDAESVERIMQSTNASVKGTAFGLGEAATVAASTVAAGIKPGEDLERTMKMVADAATIAGTDMGTMGSIINKVATADMMQMDVANQLMDAGIPIMQLLGEEMGVTAGEARDLASAGKVSFEDFQNAMEEGMGGAAQKSGETLTGAFNNSMAAIGRFGANLIQDVYPQVRDFFNGFIEWMGPVEEMGTIVGEKLGDALRNTVEWIAANRDEMAKWVPYLAIAAGIFVTWAIIQAITKWLDGMTLAVKLATIAQNLWNRSMLANPIGLIVLAIGALVAAFVWAYTNVDWFREAVDVAWAAIRTAISWAWENVIRPVFEALVGFVQNILVPAIVWLWESVIQPVFGWIGDRIKGVWEGVIQPVFQLIHDVLHNVVGPAIQWFWENVVSPVFGWIGDRISEVWEGVIKPVFEALGNFINDEVAPKIERGVEIIGDVWEGLKKLFATPINWVINTVWNNGLKKAFDAVAEAVGSDARLGRIPLIATGDSTPRGNRAGTGGRTTVGRFAKGGLAEGWSIVGEEGPELVNFTNPGRVYTAQQTAEALSGGKPMGDFNWGAAGDELKRRLSPGSWLGTDQMAAGIGNLASFASGILDPILKTAQGVLGANGLVGKVAFDAAGKAVEMVTDWARSHDEGASGAMFTGKAGGFHRPSAGPITSRYGRRWGAHHAGIDIAGGGPTYAAWNGVVAETGWNIGPGRTGIGILLNHGNRWSYYGHNPVGGVRVRPGEQVKAGQRIGAQGATGNVTGTHLHFEEHRGQAWNDVNPGYLFRDKGGNLPPGLSMVLNNTGRDEWVFNDRQLRTLDAAVRGRGGIDITNNNYVTDTTEVADKVIRKQEFSLRSAVAV